MKTRNVGLYIQGILSGIFLFLFAYPYYMWEHETLVHILRLVYGVILFLNFKNEKTSTLLIWIVLLIYLCVAFGNTIVASLVFVFSNIFLLSAQKEFIRITYKSFYNVFVFFAVLSITNYILLLCGVSMPSHTMNPLNEAKNCFYIAYPFVVTSTEAESLYRFMGLFDEPGALATYCFLFLWAEKFNIYNWKNIILMTAGILSLSLFFYLAIGIVMFIKFFSKGTNVWFRVLTIALIAAFAYSLTVDDSITAVAIGERMEFDDEKGFKGNNRSTSTLDVYYDKVRWQEPVFFLGPTLGGVDKEKVASQVAGAAGYKRAIVECGLLCCIFYFVFFLAYAKRNMKNRWDFLLFALCFSLTLYQRPFFNDIVFLFMFVSIIKLRDYQPNEIKGGLSSHRKRIYYNQAPVLNN